MSVSLVDKRRRSERIPGLDLANGTWFAVLDIPGMEKLVNQQHTNDPLSVTAAKAKKMASLVEKWTPPDGWSGIEPDVMKSYIVEFLLGCNGFRSH